MVCYVCGNKEIKKAISVFLPPKDARYKQGFRDVCEKCYESIRAEQGYVRGTNGVWKLREAYNG